MNRRAGAPLAMAAVAMGVACGSAGAQGPVQGMTDTPCGPPPPPAPPAETRPFLQPGADPSALLAQWRAPAAKAAADQRRADRAQRDWPGLCVFRAANLALVARGVRPRLVLMGDSITESWADGDPDLFHGGRPGEGDGDGDIVDRGISGQTSGQMLARFYLDVIELQPRVVQIMAGTNDIAGNTGPSRPEDFEANIEAMVDLAQAHGVRVILASVPPTDRFWWAPDLEPRPWVAALNRWLRDYAAARHLTYADYHAALAGPGDAMKPGLSNDGVHPNSAGYAVMRPLLDAALTAAAAP
jgi:lysophospholipase L1-like esterase